jgi:hypothetical protein
MQHLNNRFLRIIFLGIPLLLIIAVFVNFPLHNEKSKTDIPIQNVSNRYNPDNPEEFYDNFKIENISIERRENNRVLFTLSADKVIHRKRISRIFVYQNLKEIFMAGVRIDFYPYYKTQIDKYKNIAIPVADIVNSFTSLGKPPTSREDYLSGNSDINLDLLTRILLEDLSFNLHLPSEKMFFITTKLARINPDFENIVLGGPVSIVSPDGKELHTLEAVWSKKYNGFYFPKGYTLQKTEYKKRTFITLNAKGKFSEVSPIPEIQYTDVIEEREKTLYAYMSKKMPAHLKLMFGMTGDQ